MAIKQVNPTRMELTRLNKKLATATKGHKLLKDKRDELMRQFLDMVKLNKQLREKVEKAITEANKNFVLASASMSQEALNASMIAPKQEVLLSVGSRNIMSVNVPEYKLNYRTPEKSDIFCYGLAFTSCDLDDAVSSLSEILPDMLKLAEVEKSCQLMADEIEKTRRRVNALEHVMIPEINRSIEYISMKLDENERATQTRLMKIKDMMLKEAHRY